METILIQAQTLVYTLLGLMPTSYQRDSLQAMLGLFLEAQGHPLPQHSQTKSPSALSRFLNQYDWGTRQIIRAVRKAILKELLTYAPRGRRPWLQVIVDLTTLEKCGKFKAFEHLIHVLHGKRGLHLLVIYLVIGEFRVPWGFRVWRGKETRSPAQLAVRLVDSLPKELLSAFRVVILADTAFSSVQFLQAMKSRQLRDLLKKGQQVTLDGLSFPVTISWFYLKRNGKLEKRFVLSTRPLKASTIIWWGRRRWSIEGFFKTVKHRFGLHRFGQQTLLGVYRWLLLSMISFLLAHWVYLSTDSSKPPDWGQASASALQTLFPDVALCSLFSQVERLRPLLQSFGLQLQLVAVTT